jgi:predicted DNA binding protein
MVQARIQLDLPRERWKGGVSREYPDLSFQLLGMVMSGECAVETVVVSGGALDDSLSEIASHPDVDEFAVIERHSNNVTVHLETLDPAVLSAAATAGTPLVYPADVECGELTATVVGTHAAISELGDQLQADGFGFEVAYIRSDHDVSEVLTDRQAEVLFTAVEHGYYRSPRQCTLTEVAEVLDIAKSTCSGTLQRAEEAVIEYFCLQQQPPGRKSETRSPAVGGRSGD